MIRSVFGDDADNLLELYFHWYNIIHELGHTLMALNSPSRQSDVDEEQLVNDFAVAYWSIYGAKEKWRRFQEKIPEIFLRYRGPEIAPGDYLDYYRQKWNESATFSFHVYGWFQFQCVLESLRKKEPLSSVINRIGVANPIPQPAKTLTYPLGLDAPTMIVKDALDILSAWGMKVAKSVSVTFVDNPETHMSCWTY